LLLARHKIHRPGWPGTLHGGADDRILGGEIQPRALQADAKRLEISAGMTTVPPPAAEAALMALLIAVWLGTAGRRIPHRKQ